MAERPYFRKLVEKSLVREIDSDQIVELKLWFVLSCEPAGSG